MPDIGDLDQWEAEFDRRSIGRTRITKGALLFFKGQPGTRGCNITDLTERGARIRTHDLPLVPTTFDLTLELDREQPVLPMMPGVPERRTHSYVRHGTTSLLPRSMSPRGLSSANATSATGQSSS